MAIRSILSRSIGQWKIPMGAAYFCTSQAEVKPHLSQNSVKPPRYTREYFDSICDQLWQVRRGMRQHVNLTRLFDTPGSILDNRTWKVFLDDDLFSTWVKLLCREATRNMRPPGRLALAMMDMAKVLRSSVDIRELEDQNSKNERGMAPKGLLNDEERKNLYELLEKMMHTVFVQRQQITFKHVSAAAYALGRYTTLFDPPEEIRNRWSTIVGDWLTCGGLRDCLSPPKGVKIGLTSVTTFMGALPRLNIRLLESDMKIVAELSHRLFAKSIGTNFLTKRSMIECVRTWHAWFVDPEQYSTGWWPTWFEAYESQLNKQRSVAQSDWTMTITLIQTAILMAKDFGRSKELSRSKVLTESKLLALVEMGALTSERRGNLVSLIEIYNKSQTDEKLRFDDRVVLKLSRG